MTLPPVSKSSNENTCNEFVLANHILDGSPYHDPFFSPYEVAKERGQEVILPADTQLFIDIDSREQLESFYQRFYSFQRYDKSQNGEWQSHNLVIHETPSKTEGHYHIIITFKYKTFTHLERLAYQAALGDDPLRVFLNVLRAGNNFETPVTFFENAKENIIS